MLRKVMFSVVGAALFVVASTSTSTAEAGGPYWHGGFSHRIAPAPIYRVPPRHFGYGHVHRQYVPVPSYHYRAPFYGHRSNFYGRGFYGPGIYHRSPGFSLRIGF